MAAKKKEHNIKKLNGESKILLDSLTSQREQDRIEDKSWKLEHNESAKDFRNEIKDAISEIWRAMREGFDKMSEVLIKRTGQGTDWKMITIMISICLLIVTLLGARILSLETTMKEFKTESRETHKTLDNNLQREMTDKDKITNTKLTSLDTMLQREMRIIREKDEVAIKDLQGEIGRIRNWKDSVERTQDGIDARQDAQFGALKEFIDIKSTDRFTGAEGKMMQKQIDRLEDRLTFLTKENINKK